MEHHLYKMKEDEKYGFISKQGQWIIPAMYRRTSNFSEGLAYVRTFDNKQGYINIQNEMVIELSSAEYLGDFSHGLAIVSLNEKYGCINKKGEFAAAPRFDRMYAINSSGSFSAEVGGKWGFFDRNSNEIIKPIYDSLGTYSEGLAFFKNSGKCGFIDEHGDVVIKSIFLDVSSFSGGLASVSLDGENYGFINKSGEFVIPPKYYQLKDFSEGLAGFRTKTGGKWGYLNTSGEEVIKTKFQSVWAFK